MHGYGAEFIFILTVYYGKKIRPIFATEFAQFWRTYVSLGNIQLPHNHIHSINEIGMSSKISVLSRHECVIYTI
jgi:hypothetical protein